MENLVFKGIITTTSKKNDGDFKQEVPTKTAYIKTDEENAKKLVDFGLQKYTSKDNKEDYFIIKFPADLMIYTTSGHGIKKPELSRIYIKNSMEEYEETNNFKTPDGKMLAMNVIKGNHKNNNFYRLQAIRVETFDDIEEIKPENPFGDDEAF